MGRYPSVPTVMCVHVHVRVHTQGHIKMYISSTHVYMYMYVYIHTQGHIKMYTSSTHVYMYMRFPAVLEIKIAHMVMIEEMK